MTETFFSETGMQLSDFIWISAVYILVMLVFFAVKPRSRLNWFVLATFTFQCVLIIVFRKELNTRLYAGLMLLTALIVEGIVLRREKLTQQSR